MKFRDEYRDPAAVEQMCAVIARTATRPWSIMEVCGGQTHAILRYGLDRLLPPNITLLHGPGCPVCVTPAEYLDKAIAIALTRGVTLCSFGDMLRVPGASGDLLGAKARGADVRMVYSPLDALAIARAEPEREVVFLAVGFETTAPANAIAAWQAKRDGVRNFSLLVSQVLVPPALSALVDGARIDGFLAAGHVCAIMGLEQYEPIAARHHVPIVATGFEPLDILEGISLCVRQLEDGRAKVENQYARAVQRGGNLSALALLKEVFRIVPRNWRGIGEIDASGLALAPGYRAFDAEMRFGAIGPDRRAETECISGRILIGEKKPPDCPAFGTRCRPEHPLGATMVSGEGACAAYHRYRSRRAEAAA